MTEIELDLTERAYNPVTAIDESSATGQTAQIFADIRAVMQIPLVTSIWRGLQGIEDSLPAAWTQTKLIYASGLPARCLHSVVTQTALSQADRGTDVDWTSAAGGPSELSAALTIIDAYNRSNGLNFLTLMALLVEPSAERPEALKEDAVSWPPLRALYARSDISDHDWSLVQSVNGLGTAGPSDQVATLWRHLAHWPELLRVIARAMSPLHESGAISSAATRAISHAHREARDLAHWRGSMLSLPPLASKTVHGYVTNPAHVARMVVIGHFLANSIRQQQGLAHP